MKLTAENVNKLFLYCLFTEEEVQKAVQAGEKAPQDAIVVKGVVGTFGFHPGRVEESKDEIADLLRQLPETFHDGWSFLNAVLDKDETQWGEQKSANELLCLGQAAGFAQETLPVTFRSSLPGGVPYYTVTV